jgi:large subunit ribosomal protein L4
VLDAVTLSAPKTKDIVALINNVAQGSSALLLLAERDENVEKSARNLTNVKALRAGYLNIRDLLGYDKILLPLSALDAVNGFLAEDEAVAELEEK